MRKFLSGFICGALIFGAVSVFASGIAAVANQFPVTLNGNNVDMEGYNINGSTYFKLRDVADKTGGFNVNFKDGTIVLTTDEKATETDNTEKHSSSKLLYQGHGSFKLTLDSGKIIYIDPYAGEGYDEPADLILVTHQHPDHNKTDLPPHAEDCVIFQNTDAIKDGKYQQADIAGVHIEPVQAYNQNHDVTKCVGYLVTVNDTLLYFAGDTSKTEQMSELADRNIDYAFLPTDGHYNMDIPEAIECAEIIKAKHTVPVHMSPGELFNRERAEQFVTESALIVEAGEIIEF